MSCQLLQTNLKVANFLTYAFHSPCECPDDICIFFVHRIEKIGQHAEHPVCL